MSRENPDKLALTSGLGLRRMQAVGGSGYAVGIWKWLNLSSLEHDPSKDAFVHPQGVVNLRQDFGVGSEVELPHSSLQQHDGSALISTKSTAVAHCTRWTEVRSRAQEIWHVNYLGILFAWFPNCVC